MTATGENSTADTALPMDTVAAVVVVVVTNIFAGDALDGVPRVGDAVNEGTEAASTVAGSLLRVVTVVVTVVIEVGVVLVTVDVIAWVFGVVELAFGVVATVVGGVITTVAAGVLVGLIVMVVDV